MSLEGVTVMSHPNAFLIAKSRGLGISVEVLEKTSLLHEAIYGVTPVPDSRQDLSFNNASIYGAIPVQYKPEYPPNDAVTCRDCLCCHKWWGNLRLS
jgi:hypothetical protein